MQKNFKLLLILVCLVFSSSSQAFSVPGVAVLIEKVKTLLGKKQVVQEAPKVLIAVLTLSGRMSDVSGLVKKLYEVRHDASIHAVLIKVDSGGGRSTAGELLFNEISACAACKPVVVSVIGSCCSAALWASVGADSIVALDGSTIGSIGVVICVPKKTVRRFKDDELSGEATMEFIFSSPSKEIFHDFGSPWTNEQRAIVQREVAKLYEMFYMTVAQARGLDQAQVLSWGAKDFFGREALELGLIDRVGSFSDAVDEVLKLVKERSSISGAPELVDF
jgi:signal peptide peptidase SppA